MMQLVNMRINHHGVSPHSLWLIFEWIFIVIIIVELGGCGDEKPHANRAPIYEITYPMDQAVFNEDDQITFVSFGGDEEDGSLIDDSMVWTSSIDGKLGIGKFITRNDLSPGTHSITITATDSQGAKANDSLVIHIKRTTTSYPIANGLKTIGVRHPKDAFDGDQTTAAQIIRFWGEAGHSDYLHFVAFVGSDDLFTFKISTGASTLGSKMIIEGENISGQWKEIYRYSLDNPGVKIITITNAQSYVNENGQISLRARWIGGAQASDAFIFEISRKPSPTKPTRLTSKVIILDL
jgi:hypothetical protein